MRGTQLFSLLIGALWLGSVQADRRSPAGFLNDDINLDNAYKNDIDSRNHRHSTDERELSNDREFRDDRVFRDDQGFIDDQNSQNDRDFRNHRTNERVSTDDRDDRDSRNDRDHRDFTNNRASTDDREIRDDQDSRNDKNSKTHRDFTNDRASTDDQDFKTDRGFRDDGEFRDFRDDQDSSYDDTIAQLQRRKMQLRQALSRLQLHDTAPDRDDEAPTNQEQPLDPEPADQQAQDDEDDVALFESRYDPLNDNFYDLNEDGTYIYGYSLPYGVRRYERGFYTSHSKGLVVEGFFTQARHSADGVSYELRCYRADAYGYHPLPVQYLQRPPTVQRDVEPHVDCFRHER